VIWPYWLDNRLDIRLEWLDWLDIRLDWLDWLDIRLDWLNIRLLDSYNCRWCSWCRSIHTCSTIRSFVACRAFIPSPALVTTLTYRSISAW